MNYLFKSLRKVYFDKVILIVNKNIRKTRNYRNLNKLDIF